MKELTRTIYTCDHCNRKMFVKHAAVKHEVACTKNPDNWSACSGCEHLKEIKKQVPDERYLDGEREMNGFYCEAKKIEMYPKKCEHKGLLKKYPDSFNGLTVMPKECELRDTNRLLPF